jgi:hypothetical protein
MSENDSNLINFIATTVEALRQRVDEISEQMATKVDIANLRDEMASLKGEMATKEDLAALEFRLRDEMATKEDLTALETRLRNDLATKNDLNRLESTMRGEFEQVHLRLNTLDRATTGRIGQMETDFSRMRSVVYLLVKDKPEMLRLLGYPGPGETRPQG